MQRTWTWLAVALVGCGAPGKDDASADTDSDVGGDSRQDTDLDSADTDRGPGDEVTDIAGDQPVDPNDTDPDADGVEGDADPLPVDPGLTATLDAIIAGNAAPVLEFDQSLAGTKVTFVRTLRAEDVQAVADKGDEATVDIGPFSVRVGTFRDEGGSDPQIVIGAQDLVGLQLVSVYTRSGNATAGFGPAGLEIVGLVDPAAPDVTLGSVDPAAMSLEPSQDCQALALEQVGNMAPVAVHVPPLSSCTLAECVDVTVGWIWANHDLRRIRQLLDYISTGDEERRAWLWKQPGVTKDGGTYVFRRPGSTVDDDPIAYTWSMEHLFGPYAPHRYEAIRWATTRLWDDMHDHDLNGLALDIECTPDLAGDICNTYGKASWHHVVKSNLKACQRFFDIASTATDGWTRTLGPLHEPMHHLQVPWKDGIVTKWSPMQDTHTHAHGDLCTSDIQTNKGYGYDAVDHLAHYEAPDGGVCGHPDKAFRNNDTYMLATAGLGIGVRYGWLHRWPASPWPPGKGPASSPSIPPCSNAGIDPPPPGEHFYDPLNDCVKAGGELVCPPSNGGGGSGGAGKSVAKFDIAVNCPNP